LVESAVARALLNQTRQWSYPLSPSGTKANITPATHCRVLPPGEFKYIIPKPLPDYSESFTTTATTVSPQWWENRAFSHSGIFILRCFYAVAMATK